MRLAAIVCDMIEDFIRPDGPLPVGGEGLRIIPNLQRLKEFCRRRALPFVYANDSLMPDDFLFRSRMRPHALRGTAGTRVIDELSPEPGDLVVHKRRFSAFFRTDLDITLKEWGVDTVVLGGVATEVCILTTAYDAVCHNFEVIVLEDCCASRFRENHEKVISLLRNGPLYPLLRVMGLSDLVKLNV